MNDLFHEGLYIMNVIFLAKYVVFVFWKYIHTNAEYNLIVAVVVSVVTVNVISKLLFQCVMDVFVRHIHVKHDDFIHFNANDPVIDLLF